MLEYGTRNGMVLLAMVQQTIQKHFKNLMEKVFNSQIKLTYVLIFFLIATHVFLASTSLIAV